MENYDPAWDEMEIMAELERSDQPRTMSELSNTTKIPYHRVCIVVVRLIKKNRLSFSCHSQSRLVPGGVRSGNELSTGGSSFGNELSYKIKALKPGGKDYKYYWLCGGNDTPLVYIGGGNIKSPLANRYRCAIEEAIKRGEFEYLSKAELKRLVSQIKSQEKEKMGNLHNPKLSPAPIVE
jgi:hypothetical protein